MIYIGRAMTGICVGFLSMSLPVYLGETIQPEIRGTLGLLPTTIGNFGKKTIDINHPIQMRLSSFIGILFCYFIGSYVNWSTLAYIGSAIPLLFFSMMIFVPETPRWYVSKGKSRFDLRRNVSLYESSLIIFQGKTKMPKAH